MKKNIYLILCGASIILLGVTLYVAITKSSEARLPIALVPTTATTTLPTPKEYTTATGKIFTVLDTHPNGESLSMITVSGKGFDASSTFSFEKDTLKNIFVTDLDKNGFDELYLITQSAGSGSYGEVTGFASNNDTSLSEITVPKITDEEKAAGGTFEHYQGHDIYALENGILTRSFPLYMASDTNSSPTGGTKKITYSLEKGADSFFLQAHDEVAVASPSASTTLSTSTINALLLGTKWGWVNSTGTKLETVQKGKEKKFILTFDADKHMSSKTDCNTLNATYTLAKNKITFGPMLSTMMFCEDSQEQAYSAQLNQISTYEIKGNELIFTLLKNAGTMTFRKQ